jgi:hypothetical protein
LKSDDAKTWENTRKIGRWQFVAKKGVAAWGIPMFLMTCLMYPPKSTAGYAAMALWWIFVSLCYGIAAWHFQEKAFGKFAANDQVR